MPSNFRVAGVDTDDIFIRREIFLDATPQGLWLWGRNDWGQLGDNTTIFRSSPVQTVSGGSDWRQAVRGISTSSGGIKVDGTLWTWGRGSFGERGDNSTVAFRSSPTQTIAGGYDWKQTAMGENFTAAIKTDGTLWTWGRNYFGQLGDNTKIHRSSPVQILGGGTNWRQVSLGKECAASIKTDGTLWVWGRNIGGGLGDNTVIDKSSPVQTISGGTNWKQVSAGGYSSYCMAIKTDGTLWTWGANGYGNLGDNTIVNKSSPVQILGGGTNWKQVPVNSCSGTSSAIKNDGTLWTWGSGLQGQLGADFTGSRSSPIQTIAGGNNWKQVAIGSNGQVALKTDGTVWTWGSNQYADLGDNTVISKSSPVQIFGGGTNWRSISAGFRGGSVIRGV
jgi:alpha-tubulin suppressor-like RCC1 family protein